VKCKECKNDISDKAKACPHCGAKLKMSLLTKVVLSVFGFFLFLTFLGLATESGKSGSALPQPALSKDDQAKAQKLADQHVESGGGQRQTWEYSEEEDKMGRGKIHYASIASDETVNFDFPYQGAQHATLTVRRGGKNGLSIMLSIERGQFGCGIEGCNLKVRFDGGKPFSVHASEPSDNSTEMVFLNGEASLLSRIKKSKRMQVESSFYQQGSHVFTFQTAGLEFTK
jgi:hypothetical protein